MELEETPMKYPSTYEDCDAGNFAGQIINDEDGTNLNYVNCDYGEYNNINPGNKFDLQENLDSSYADLHRSNSASTRDLNSQISPPIIPFRTRITYKKERPEIYTWSY